MGRSKLVASFISQIEAEAYRRGFNDALRAVSGAVKRLRPSTSGHATEHEIEPIPPKVNSNPQLPLDRARPLRLRENSDQMRVFRTIRENPGLRGIEIVRAIETAGHTIHERTVRTALSRLKRADMIEQQEDKWYEKQTGQSP